MIYNMAEHDVLTGNLFSKKLVNHLTLHFLTVLIRYYYHTLAIVYLTSLSLDTVLNPIKRFVEH